MRSSNPEYRITSFVFPPANPYIAGNPVGNSQAFVGREDALREVLHMLRSPNQNAITFCGQRRIGKTSALQFLQARLSGKKAATGRSISICRIRPPGRWDAC